MKRRTFLQTSIIASASLVMLDFGHGSVVRPIKQNKIRLRARGSILQNLFFVPEKIKATKERLAQDVEFRRRWLKFVQVADALIDKSNSQSVASMETSLTLGLAWLVTHDKRYADGLKKLLLACADLKKWGGQDVLERIPAWHSSLGTASQTVGAVIGCEALEGYLSAGEKQHVASSIIQKGVTPILNDWVLPENRIHALDSMGHNWWCVCISGAGIGALSLVEEESMLVDWLTKIETALSGFFNYQGMVLLNKPANFDPTGAYYESVHYACYALEAYLMFRLAWTNVILNPPQEVPILERMAEFFVHTLYPASSGDVALNFGDSSLRPDATLTMRLLSIFGFSPSLSQWYLERLEPNSIHPLAFLYPSDQGIRAVNSLPQSIIYPGIGWAIFRDSWGEDATFLAMKSGFTWNHAHADAGSFVLYHKGKPLLIDSGKCNYGNNEYLDYYCQSKAHNVVLYNGQGQPAEDFHERGVKFPGRMHDFLDGLGVRYVCADAAGPMARYFKRNYRHWIWIDNVILIFDDILAHESGKFDWVLHYSATARFDQDKVVISDGDAELYFKMLYPNSVIQQEQDGLKPDHPDKKTKYLKFSTSKPALEQKFVTAIITCSSGLTNTVPEVELIQRDEALGARIQSKGYVTDIFLNLLSDGCRMNLNSNNNIDGWDTDAYLLGVTRPAGGTQFKTEDVSRYFVVGCSYLRRNGQSIFDSFSKATFVLKNENNVPELIVHGQPQTEMAVLCDKKPKNLFINGKKMTFTYEESRNLCRFQV